MALSYLPDLETIYSCKACVGDHRKFAEKCFAATGHGLLKKHPPIGHGRELFFVNINPRSTNNPAMEWAMADFQNFKELAENRFRELAYIPNSERFYDIHHSICEHIFPGRAFETVAMVHELYLCASPNSAGLPGCLSPCAERYLRPHLCSIKPTLVITFGQSPAKYFGMRSEGRLGTVGVGEDCELEVLTLPFPRMWSKSLVDKLTKWVREVFMAVQARTIVPSQDFNWPKRKHTKSYILIPLSLAVKGALESLAPQAQACYQILRLGHKSTYIEEELQELFCTHAGLLNTRQSPWRIFQYYRQALRDIGALDWQEPE